MNLDVLAAMFTLLLIATMIGLASKGEPVAGAMYIVYGGGIYLFWQVMRGLAYATTSKTSFEARIELRPTGKTLQQDIGCYSFAQSYLMHILLE